LLAPFLDRLITDKLDEGFTSSQALRFFEPMCMALTPAELSDPVPPDLGYWEPGKYDRWHGLSGDFVKQWGHCRAPVPSFYTRLLRNIYLSNWGMWCVKAIRHFVRSSYNAIIYSHAVIFTYISAS
ncbi:hypothetical protein M422DRAFT_175689, partial [Sphaerobolus stellatus SS14]